MAVAIVVEKSAAGAPAHLFVVDSGFARHVGKCAVAVVVEQNVVSPEAAEEIVPAVVVVVADADAGLPAGARQAGFFGDVGECSVAIIFVELRGRRLSRRPFLVEARSVGQINVEPSVVVVIEKCDAAAFGFDDVAFVIDASPDVRDVQSGFAGNVDELDAVESMDGVAAASSPARSQTSAFHPQSGVVSASSSVCRERRAKSRETSPGKIHQGDLEMRRIISGSRFWGMCAARFLRLLSPR